jgi:hypothetical protein
MKTSYIFKHWCFTLLTGPLALAAWQLLSNPQKLDADRVFGFYIIIFVYSIFFSIPALVVYALMFILLKHYRVKPVIAKTVLIVLTVFGIVITFSSLGGSSLLELTGAYSFATIVTGILLKIKKRADPNEYVDSIFEV